MASSINAVLTDLGRVRIAKHILDPADGNYLALTWDLFRIGVAGYEEDEAGNRSPKPPDPARTTIESEDDGVYYFEKVLVAGDITFESPSIVKVQCQVNADESNAITSPYPDEGDAPVFWEIGIYSSDGVGGYDLLTYGTFPAQTKDEFTILLHNAKLIV